MAAPTNDPLTDGSRPSEEATPLGESLRLVASMVRRRPLPFTVSVIGSIVFAAATVGGTVVLGRVIDEVVVPEFETADGTSARTIWLGVTAVVVVAVIRAASVVARRYYAGMTAVGVQRSLRDELGDKYVDLPLTWHRTQPTGRLLAHVDADVEVASEALHPLPFSLGVSSLAVFAAITAVWVDLVLAAIGFVIFPVMVWMNRVYSRRIERPAARVQESIAGVSAIAHESFDGALIVKTLGRADSESRRFDVAVTELRRDRVRLGTLKAAFQSAIEALPQMGIVAVTLAGVFRLESGAVTAGELVQFVALFSVLAFPMQVFGFFLQSLPPSVVAHDRLSSVLRTALPPRPTVTGVGNGGAARLDVEGLAHAHDDGAPVLRRIDLELTPGETVALVGSTGSGKSTLVDLLAGLAHPTSGRIRLDGTPIDEIAPEVRTRQIAVVAQEPFLFADSVRHNIDLDGTATDDDIRWAASVACADEFVDELGQGYDTLLGERGVTVSGGQRQRLALARALVRRPRLLLLDDATSAVDPRIEQRILERLERELDMTVVIVAHRLSTIELADRVVFLRDGAIRATGTHAELLGDPEYARLATAYARDEVVS